MQVRPDDNGRRRYVVRKCLKVGLKVHILFHFGFIFYRQSV